MQLLKSFYLVDIVYLLTYTDTQYRHDKNDTHRVCLAYIYRGAEMAPLLHERKKRHYLATIPFQNFPEQSACLLYNGSNWMPTRSIERWSVQGPASLVKSSLAGFTIGLHRRRAA